jgi:hypothetical protein
MCLIVGTQLGHHLLAQRRHRLRTARAYGDTARLFPAPFDREDDFHVIAATRAQHGTDDRPREGTPAGIDVEFAAADALQLERLGRRFQTVLDCGLFHTFDGEERPRYVASLASVTGHDGTLYVAVLQ